MEENGVHKDCPVAIQLAFWCTFWILPRNWNWTRQATCFSASSRERFVWPFLLRKGLGAIGRTIVVVLLSAKLIWAPSLWPLDSCQDHRTWQLFSPGLPSSIVWRSWVDTTETLRFNHVQVLVHFNCQWAVKWAFQWLTFLVNSNCFNHLIVRCELTLHCFRL